LDVLEVARKGPGFVDVVFVAVSEDPAAVGSAFEGREKEVDVGTYELSTTRIP
jgi:hypothetical protein